ncbi:MAG: cadherin repeat domain-containing protein, partial [Pseudomonadota bacterium]
DTPATLQVAENQTTVATIQASDAEDDPLSFLPLGGDDADLFDFNTATGALSFKSAPDFENPIDVGGPNGDNGYVVEVGVTDGQETTTKTITVQVTDVDDTGGGGGRIELTADPSLAGSPDTADTPWGDFVAVRPRAYPNTQEAELTYSAEFGFGVEDYFSSTEDPNQISFTQEGIAV